MKKNVELPDTPTQGLFQSSGEIQLISFRVAGEEFGVPIDKVKEILKPAVITPVPRAPAYLLGMMNLRGTIIPVLDLKLRLGRDAYIKTSKTRVLVLSVGGDLSGIVVDEVSEVQRIDTAAIEPPPQVTRGIDKFFLSGIARLNSGRRLIMLLNLMEVLNVEIFKGKKNLADTMTADADVREKTVQRVEEEHLAVYCLGDQEFAVDIAKVKEILRVEEITVVPNVPDYVQGIRNVRETVLPIIDLRRLVNMPAMEQAHAQTVEHLQAGHLAWVADLRDTVYNGTPFSKTLDPTECALGKLLEYRKKNDVEFGEMYTKFKPPHDALHSGAGEIQKLMRSDKAAATAYFEGDIQHSLNVLLKLFQLLEEFFIQRTKKEQRVLIVGIGSTTVGLLVDRVNEVVRLPKNIIDTTPAILSSYGKEIKGVAKLNHGTRLILLMDEGALFSGDQMEALSRIAEESDDGAAEEQEIVERQYVIFSIAGEEFGVTINKVQEIFKPEDLTPVPKSPPFIKGVVNLRGTIIPVVDVKERFGVKTGSAVKGTSAVQQLDQAEATNQANQANQAEQVEKILVTIIKETTVGLLVDSVQEVLRIQVNRIEAAPALVLSNVDTAYLEGIAKLDEGRRIILLLDIEEIMSAQEYRKLKHMEAEHLQKLEQGTTEKHTKEKSEPDAAEKIEQKKELVSETTDKGLPLVVPEIVEAVVPQKESAVKKKPQKASVGSKRTKKR